MIADKVVDGKRMLTHLLGDDSQQLQGIGMIRLDRRNTGGHLLGQLQPAGLMVLNREGQGLGNCRHTAYYAAGRVWLQTRKGRK